MWLGLNTVQSKRFNFILLQDLQRPEVYDNFQWIGGDTPVHVQRHPGDPHI